MKATYYGHASLGLEIGNSNLLFDPFISPNPKASHIDPNSIEADYILISHGHEDHVADALSIAKRTGATIVSNFEIVSWFGSQGVEKGHPMNFGGKWNFDFGSVKYVPALHSSVLPDGTYGGNPGGFVVESGSESIYYSGDTALTYDMKLIAEDYNLTAAALCIGDNFTMGVDDAVKAAQFVNVKKVIGIHFDTFGYIEINHEDAKAKFKQAGIELILLDIGSSVTI